MTAQRHVGPVQPRPRENRGIDQIVYRYDRPVIFYVPATAMLWACWCIAVVGAVFLFQSLPRFSELFRRDVYDRPDSKIIQTVLLLLLSLLIVLLDRKLFFNKPAIPNR